MLSLLRTELYKIFRRPRTYISFATITAIVLVVQMAMLTDGQSFMEFFMQGINEQFELSGNIINGYLVTYVILGLLLVHVPLLVALVGGDVLAGEATNGTLRLLLTKPYSRTKIIIAKFLAGAVYAVCLLLWLALMALGLSLIIFGDGDMLNARSDEIVLLLRDDIMWRYIAAFGFAALAMTVVCSLSIFLSVFSDNAIGPIVGTMGVIIFFTIITNLELPVFNAIKPLLFTTHMLGWKGFFGDPVPYGAIGKSVAVLFGYIGIFLGGTIFVFNRKDIQS